MKPTVESDTWNHKLIAWAALPIYWVILNTTPLTPMEVLVFV
jgi:hypothetical protein